MSSPETPTTDRVDLAVGAAGALLANTAFVLIVHRDQRMLLLLFATVLLGMGLLLTERRGALGMGILIGAGLSIVTGLILVAVGGSIVPGA